VRSVFVAVGDDYRVSQSHVLSHVTGRHQMACSGIEIGRGDERHLLASVGAQREPIYLLNARAFDRKQDAADGLGARRRGRRCATQPTQQQRSDDKNRSQPRNSFNRCVNAGTICFQSPTTP
jgi:hypothetical protein